MENNVHPPQHLQGTLDLPADKSISHRAALFAALYDGKSIITNFSEAADPHSTLACLRRLGVAVDLPEKTMVEIEGVGRDGLHTPSENLDCGNSGTTMRLLSGIIAGAGVSGRLTGDASLSARTMRRIIDPLIEMGVDIEARDGDFAPLSISHNGKVKPLRFPLPIPSAQLKSCVLLAGLFGDEPTEVIETLPSRDHTERLLKLPVNETDGRKVIRSSRKNAIPEQSYRVPNDFSAAAFWLAGGAIHPEAELHLPGVGLNPPRTGALDILRQMGADVTIENKRWEGSEPAGDISVRSSSLQPIHITQEIVPNCIDEIPVLAIAMLFADGISRISGAEELRHKETDRLHAVAEILEAAGADYTEFEDGFEIKGNPYFRPESAVYKSYHDHRIAMSAAVLAMMGTSASSVSDGECTAISYPDFWDDLALVSDIK